MNVLMFLSVVLSSVNLLEVVPLYFLGSTLIFIGIDLLYEWIFEVFHKLIPSEYAVLFTTFVAIQFVGIDGGIIFGVIVAVVEYVVSNSRLSSLRKVSKQSRAVWQPHHRKLLQEVVYERQNPKILTLEIRETVFFGSSLNLLSRICDEIGINASAHDIYELSIASPRHFSKSPLSPTASSLASIKRNRKGGDGKQQACIKERKRRPKYVLLDLSQVPNVDASAARSCFLQLAKMCHKNGISMIATGPNTRVDWVLRSHDVAYSLEEEAVIKNELLYPHRGIQADIPSGKVLLFDSLNIALEHCETKLLFDLEQRKSNTMYIAPASVIPHSSMESGHSMKTKLSTIIGRILGTKDEKEKEKLCHLDKGGKCQVEEIEYFYGDDVYTENEHADSFYVVLIGCVDICRDSATENLTHSGRKLADTSTTSFGEVISYMQVGSVFGYIDFSLGRRRRINAVCSKDNTIVAKFTKDFMDELERTEPDLYRCLEKVLLQTSLIELANHDVA